MLVPTHELLIEEIEGDSLTPIAVYQRISGKRKFLFESSDKHHESGRFSFIGSDPFAELLSINGETLLNKDNEVSKRDESFAEAMELLMPKIENPLEIPFIGGGIGYIGYDYIRNHENIGEVNKDTLGMPDAHMMFFNEILVFDHLKQKLYLIGIPLLEQTSEDLVSRLNSRKTEIFTSHASKEIGSFRLSEFTASSGEEEYKNSVCIAKELIKAGEIFQVVLSRRLTAKAEGDPFAFYRRLRVNNPSPYMYFLDFDGYAIAGSSPESLVKFRDGKIMTNPIAGTRPRGQSKQEDERLEQELKQDEKELAEHRMLVDLARNDLGKICDIGSVKVNKYLNVERYQFLMHLVSEVTGKLSASVKPLDGLAACLPAGTVSGAPKIRAMQIINKLETEKRGVYSGAIGYLSACGTMDFALAIRTLIVKDGKGYLQAGAGIVFDSDPNREFEETQHKLKALVEAANDSSNR
jgi:anthranilate synthase component I